LTALGGVNVSFESIRFANRRKRMSTLVAVSYTEPYRAEEVRLMLRKMQKDYLIDLEDAVVAVKDEKGSCTRRST
jgi:uncharacterized membrane protein